jgi:hypothetical protein
LRRLLNPGFLASYWSAGFGGFLQSLILIGWRIVQILRQRRWKTTNTSQITLSAIQPWQANPLLSMKNYTPLLISRNNKNKQLTLLSQSKLALTAINKLFALSNHRSP